MKDVERNEQINLIYFYSIVINTQKPEVIHVKNDNKRKIFHTLSLILGDCLGLVHSPCSSEKKTKLDNFKRTSPCSIHRNKTCSLFRGGHLC